MPEGKSTTPRKTLQATWSNFSMMRWQALQAICIPDAHRNCSFLCRCMNVNRMCRMDSLRRVHVFMPANNRTELLYFSLKPNQFYSHQFMSLSFSSEAFSGMYVCIQNVHYAQEAGQAHFVLHVKGNQIGISQCVNGCQCRSLRPA